MLFPSTTWLGGLAPLLGWIVVLLTIAIGATALSLFLAISLRHIMRALRLGGMDSLRASGVNVLESFIISVLAFCLAAGVPYAIIWLLVFQPLILLAGCVVLSLIAAPATVLVWKKIYRFRSKADAAPEPKDQASRPGGEARPDLKAK